MTEDTTGTRQRLPQSVGGATRTGQSARNAVVGVLVQGILVILGVIVRSVFVATLGMELVGVDSVFLSVMVLLGLADAGLSTAVMHAMYRPLRERDHARVAALVQFTGTLYRWVAVAVLGLGLAVLPFLTRMTNTEQPVPHLHVAFVVLLLGTSVSFLFSHRTTLLIADQRAHLANLWALVFRGGRMVLQIVLLLVFADYVLFVLLTALGTVGNAMWSNARVRKLYPYLGAQAATLPRTVRQELARGVRAMLSYRIAGVVLNNATPLLVVAMCGALVGGKYANHMFVVGALLLLLETFFLGVSASVGHLAAEGDPVRARSVLDEMALLAAILYGVAAVGIVVLLGDVVELWMGPRSALTSVEVMAIALNFLVYGLLSPVYAFRTATGLFRDARYVMALTAVVSVLLALALGRFFGLSGILLATPFARLVTNYWIEPRMLFRRHLSGSLSRFMLRQLQFVAVILVSTVLVWSIPGPESLGVRLAVGTVLSVGVPLLLFWCCFLRTPELRALRARAVFLAGRWSRLRGRSQGVGQDAEL